MPSVFHLLVTSLLLVQLGESSIWGNLAELKEDVLGMKEKMDKDGKGSLHRILSQYKGNKKSQKEGRTDPEVHMNVGTTGTSGNHAGLVQILNTYLGELLAGREEILEQSNSRQTEIIRYHGYPVESYTVPTEDGFLLGVQRIPRGRRDTGPKPRPVVFLQHGLLCSSTNWVTNLPNESLAFILADAGYDVWLGNMRGNSYSRRHETLDPGMAAFWAWSWDEHAAKDLPAMLNYALKVSKAAQLYYVGHSQGTLIAFAQLSHDPELSKKVKMFFAMGPVTTAGHAIGPVQLLARLTPDLQELFNLFGLHEFLPNDLVMDLLARTFCMYETRALCRDFLFILAGFDISNFNKSRLPVYISHTPAGTSVQNMVHFSQMVRHSTFQMYDYGSTEQNKKKYGQPVPPLYNATNVKVPVVLFSGDKDWLADVEDVDLLANALPNVVHHYHIPTWNHLDFIWGMDAPSVVYNKIIAYLDKDSANDRDGH